MILTAMGSSPSGESLERIRKAPNYRNSQFQNLEHTPMMAEGYHMGKVMVDMMRRRSDRNPNKTIPSIRTDLHKLAEGALVWFGHSSYLLRLNGRTVLVDPVFSGNASPVSFMIGAFNGSNTYQPADMPDIDILVITHDHYDHLDHKTVTALRDKVKQVVCSLGVGAHLLQWGYTAEQVHELYWHESVTIDHELIFTAEPARHFSGRGITRNRSLWSAFVLQTPDRRIFLGGDSGYGKHFADIGSRYSGFDLALLECGQYNPAWKYIHMMPEETVQAAKELGATTLIPVHWGKFALSLHAWHEPADRVFAEASRLGFPLATPMIGEPFLIGSKPLKQEWWRSIC